MCIDTHRTTCLYSFGWLCLFTSKRTISQNSCHRKRGRETQSECCMDDAKREHKKIQPHQHPVRNGFTFMLGFVLCRLYLSAPPLSQCHCFTVIPVIIIVIRLMCTERSCFIDDDDNDDTRESYTFRKYRERHREYSCIFIYNVLCFNFNFTLALSA